MTDSSNRAGDAPSPSDEPALSVAVRDDHSDDLMLLAQIARWDAAALAALYDRYHRLVYTLALRMTGTTGAAEAVVEQIFAAIWQNATTLAVDAQPFQRWIVAQTRWYAAASVPGSADETDVQECGTIVPADVCQALSALDEAQRQALERVYYERRSLADLASDMGVSERQVKAHLRVAMQRLAALLGLARA